MFGSYPGVAPEFLRRRGYGPRQGGLSTLIVWPTRKFWYCIVLTLISLATLFKPTLTNLLQSPFLRAVQVFE